MQIELDRIADYINHLAKVGVIYDSQPPMVRIVAVEAVGDKLKVVREDGVSRLTSCGDYFIVALRRLKRDETKKVEYALNPLADLHMLYLGAGFRREVFIVTLGRDFAYVISRDENGAYQQKMPLSCLYLFVKMHVC